MSLQGNLTLALQRVATEFNNLPLAGAAGSGAAANQALAEAIESLQTEAMVTGRTDDWAPTYDQTTSGFNITNTGNVNISGIAAPASSGAWIVKCGGTNRVRLLDASTNSVAANRFDLGGANYTIQPGEFATIFYSTTTSTWTII